jgi:hypothetical protein
MGLDATAYRRLIFVAAMPDDRSTIDWEKHDGDIQVWDHPDFPGRLGSLKPGFYTCDFKNDAQDAFGGAYSFYNRWREWLAQIAGYPTAPYTVWGVTTQRHDAGAWRAGAGPFYELIWFSDCEGVIGTDICAKLAKDFADKRDHAKSASALVEGGDRYFAIYEKWQRAFEFASDGGCVRFH